MQCPLRRSSDGFLKQKVKRLVTEKSTLYNIIQQAKQKSKLQLLMKYKDNTNVEEYTLKLEHHQLGLGVLQAGAASLFPRGEGSI